MVYFPDVTPATIDLTGSQGECRVEWFDPFRGATMTGDSLSAGSVSRFAPAFERDAVLYLYAA